jgi:hypothetical protein
MARIYGRLACQLTARPSSSGRTLITATTGKGEEEMILMGHAGQGGRPVILLKSGQQALGIAAEVGNARRP